MFKTNLDEVYKVDKSKEKEGVWVCDVGMPGIDFKLRRTTNNPDYAEYSRKLLRPYRRQLSNGTLSPEIMNNITNKVLSKTVVKDWRGIKDENDVEIPFSEKTCIELFEAYPDLTEDISVAASDIGNFRPDEEDEKNSEGA